jgi:hypothetical protein
MAEDCDHQTITLDDGRDVCPFCDDVPIKTTDKGDSS